ncbi:hypothetical protein Btru_030472 [Bulinus truncatus]|nr:hypothetical protein Btru_030472 [Bulinus truncatus]
MLKGKTSLGKGDVKKVRYVPWIKMFTSGPLWAVIVGHFCSTIWPTRSLPQALTFMKESLNFDINRTGYYQRCPTSASFSQLLPLVTWQIGSDRKAGCPQRMSGNHSKFFVNLIISNIMDKSSSMRRYAGILFGITNTAGTIPGMIAPIIAGALTPNRTAEEWKAVFYMCAAVTAFGAVVFFFLADGELQEWAVPPDLKIKMDIVAAHLDDTAQNNKTNDTVAGKVQQGIDPPDIVPVIEVYRF